MLAMKGGHGTGENHTFPDRGDIEQAMKQHEDEQFIDMYGDGSYTTPHTWWAALGGAGLYVPSQLKTEGEGYNEEQNLSILALGQTGS